jgi:hypothetical protein
MELLTKVQNGEVRLGKKGKLIAVKTGSREDLSPSGNINSSGLSRLDQGEKRRYQSQLRGPAKKPPPPLMFMQDENPYYEEDQEQKSNYQRDSGAYPS